MVSYEVHHRQDMPGAIVGLGDLPSPLSTDFLQAT
jgi:hypothetical protein